MSDTQNISSTGSHLRIDYARSGQYLYPEAPDLTFGQKLKRSVSKAMSFLGPVGSVLAAALIPGAGVPIAAGLYGLTNVSNNYLSKEQNLDAIAMQSQMPKSVSVPGLFSATPQSQGELATDFMAPSQMQPQIETTIIQRSQAQEEMLRNF